MNETPVRVRVTYAKGGNLRFIGHLDTQRMFERALRRSKLPLRYTQGFNKHLRINLASALPLGFTSVAEMLDFWMNEPLEPDLIRTRLTKSLPAEIKLLDVRLIENNLPSLQGSLAASEYEITFPDHLSAGQIENSLEELLRGESIPITRRGKSIDLKPMILDYIFTETEKNQPLLRIRMSSSASANARPDDLLEKMGLDPAECKVERTKLIFKE